MVQYKYDGWGNCKVCNANGTEITDTNHIGNLNPFRYRSYYFDTETKLYFLQSRYYDPEIGRFLTIDDISYLNADSVNGLNLYAYCNNNPVIYADYDGHFAILALVLGLTALVGMGLTIGGVVSNNNTLTAIGLTMIAVPALISGGLAISLLTSVGVTVGSITTLAGIGTGLFASAEWQQATTGNNWILDAGMSESWYNGLMLTFATIATLGTIASGTVYSLKISKVLQKGLINGVRANKGYPGIRFTDKSGAIRSIELHMAHQGHGIHLQLNNWWLNKAGYIGKYYRAFAKHLEIFKFWKGWF